MDPKYIIEGQLRLQDNIRKARELYGETFDVDIIKTKFYNFIGRDDLIPTLVCSNDHSIVLGRPKYPENLTSDKYKVFLFSDPYTPEIYRLYMYVI